MIDASAILATESINENMFKIYPNPSTAIFNIQRKGTEKMQVSVYGVTGRLVFSDDNIFNANYKLNLSRVSKGIYFLKIIEGEKQVTKRLMVY